MVRNNAYQAKGWRQFFPFLMWGPALNKSTIHADLQAGLTNAVIVLPQGVAYALIAGMPPQYGLYAAIVPAMIAALFGSSFHLISGPTAALSIVVFTTISPMAEPGSAGFIQLALTLTLLAGLFQLGLALARLGVLVNFVSHSVVIGFTSGAAVVIASSQMKNLLGIDITSDGSFFSVWDNVLANIAETNFYALGVAMATLATCILCKKLLPKWPNMLIAIVVGSLLAIAIGAEEHNIALVGTIPASLPPLSVPEFSFSLFSQLASGGLAIALLGLVEAVSIARSVATRSHQTINGNQEFMGQALSNIVGSFFSCYASSGSFTRTGVNYSAGAKTPLAAIFAAVSLAVIVLLMSDLTAFVPIPSMAGILLVVSWNLIDFHHIKGIFRANRSEASILIVTFLATLMIAMEFAIYIGVILSLVFYLKRTSRPKIVDMLPDPELMTPYFEHDRGLDAENIPQLRIVQIEGSLFFGAVNYVQERLQKYPESHVLIVGNSINFTDIAGAEMLAQEAKRRSEVGGSLYLSNVKDQVFQFLEKNGQINYIGKDNIFRDEDEAIAYIFSRFYKKEEMCA